MSEAFDIDGGTTTPADPVAARDAKLAEIVALIEAEPRASKRRQMRKQLERMMARLGTPVSLRKPGHQQLGRRRERKTAVLRRANELGIAPHLGGLWR